MGEIGRGVVSEYYGTSSNDGHTASYSVRHKITHHTKLHL